MYKVGHPRSPFIYSGHRSFTRPDFCEKRVLEPLILERIPSKDQMLLPLPTFPRKCNSKVPTTKEQKVDYEAVAFLSKSWRDFSETADGHPDESIVHYKPKKDILKDFVAFDVEKFLTERLLRAVDLDPKFVNAL
ncbi:hypothetical protein AB6A40_003028 [Gnathostoma spinigerum]|uniref:Uncharacterized protein n=1 Tax=Gnathostoma spinigerum TaxID=75299 RepID=A0ABD6E8B5_9BILA